MTRNCARALERLLRADAHAGEFLEAPPAWVAAAGIAPAAAHAMDTPRQFGPWRVLRTLGSGGMGEVWLAERSDGEFEQHAAVKQLAYPTPGLLQRFRQERQILARLEHPNIARLIDGGVDAAGAPYLVMEYVDGEPITGYARRQALDLHARLRLFLLVCDAVQYAHQNLVVHRDLKPSNIFVTAEGAAKLLDFGIAKVLASTGPSSAPTHTLARMLTPGYAAPEQFRGGAITTAVDVYALGVVLYELLSEARPPRPALPDASDNAQTLPPPSAALDGASANAAARRRALRGDLDRIALTALAHDPARRYASAEALAADIRRHLQGRPIAARGDSRWYRLRKFVRRNRYGVAAAVLVLMVSLAAAAIIVRQARVAREQAARAEAVRAFLVSVFEQTSPDQNRGQPITAQQLLNIGAARLADWRIESAATHTELTGLIGSLYWDIGDYANAQPMLQQAVAMSDAAPVSDAVKARNLLWLARAEQEKNLFDAATDHATQAFALAQRAGRSGADEASAARRLIAGARLGKGDARDVEPLLRDALARDRADYGERSQAVVDDLFLLGGTLKELSRFDEAIEVSRQALDLTTALHGRVHSGAVNALESLASALGHKGDYVAAEQHLREAVSIAEQVFGADHRETVVAQSNLYWTLEGQGRYAEALPGRLRQVALIERTMAATRPEQLAYAWNFVSTDYQSLGRFEEAETAVRKSLATWAAINGTEAGWDSSDALGNLGTIQQLQGRYADAEATFRQVLAIQAAHEPAESGWLNRTRGNLGNVMRLDRRPAEAVQEIAAALAALPSTATPIRAYLQALLGEAQLDAGDPVAAETTATEALATARQTMAAGNARLATPLYTLARTQLARGDAIKAEPLLREALAVRSPVFAESDLRLLELKVALAGALRQLGHLDDARRLAAEIEPSLAASAVPYAAELRARLLAR